jgi:serine/threonine-protein kinase
MSERFIRCPHCGLPHDIGHTVCPKTGKPLRKSARSSAASVVAQASREASAPSRPAVSAEPPTRPGARGPMKAPSHDLIGKTIGGKYFIHDLLGEGGMGTVFEAENIPLGRSVAVKVLHPAQAKKKVAVKRFHQEARAAGAIGHPNICEVYDLGTLDDGCPYLVMEKLVGETLADRIANEGGLPFDDVIDVLSQVLSGLVAAHEKGIVHRDIKPENVFLTKRVGIPPVAKLLDFGVSKMILTGDSSREELDLTRTGMVMGTPFYMSPEQARGDRNLDARVDLWACGVLMYEALTGKRPYMAANYNALLLQILSSTPRPARELRPALPEGFEEVIGRAMMRDRNERYQTAPEFQRALSALHARRPPSAPRVSVREGAQTEVEPGPRERAPSKPIQARRAPIVDPLSRLPSLEPRDDSIDVPVDFESDTPSTDSGMHFALHSPHLDSGEVEAQGHGGSTAAADPFDDQPTEIQHTEDWEDLTMRRPREETERLGYRPRTGRTPPPDVEQTVKIEGDIEHVYRDPTDPGKRRKG